MTRTLDSDMDVLLGLSSLSRVLVGFGEGVWMQRVSDCADELGGLVGLGASKGLARRVDDVMTQ
jgi:hypothetical protein